MNGWFRTLKTKYEAQIASVFILHLNTRDLVDGAVSLPRYLDQALVARDLVIHYDIARGLHCALPSQDARLAALIQDERGGSQGTGPGNVLSELGIGTTGPTNTAPDPDEVLASVGISEALNFLERLLQGKVSDDRGTPSVAVVIEDAEALFPTADLATMDAGQRAALVRITHWGTDPYIAQAGNPVFLIAQNLADLHPWLRSANAKFEPIPVPLPNRDQRLAFIQAKLEGITLDMQITPDQLANATAGLGYRHIEDVLLRGVAEGQLTYEMARDRKREIVAAEYSELVEFVEPIYGWETIGGLSHVKDFFDRNVIRPIREGRKQRVPMGVLMTGPAGTGKSAVAIAVAKESGVNAMKWNIGGQVASKWQGEGERNMRRLIELAKATKPVIVFIDEIDQVVRRGSGSTGGSQQDNRIFQMLMEFMSDTSHRGEIVFLAATNRPDLMDAALKRPGRFDKKVPFLVPDQGERKEIFLIMALRYHLIGLKNVPKGVLAATDGWTGAEVEAAVIKAVEVAEDLGLDAEAALDRAVRRLRPSTADIEFMTKIALLECNDLDLIPERYRKQFEDRAVLEAEVRTIADTRSGQRTL